MAEAACFSCVSDVHKARMMELVLLCRILQALDPMANCDVQSLMAEASCFGCLSSTQMDILRLQLLCNIAVIGGGGGSGGGGGVLMFDGINPSGAPGVFTAALAYRKDTGEVWYWDNSTLAWVQIVF